MSRENSLDNIKVLITGSRGFVGSFLKGHFNNKCLPVRNVDLQNNEVFCNLEIAEDYKNIRFTPDVIIHCAADPSTRYSKNTVNQVKNNIQSTINILEKFDNFHMINISSIMVYEDFYNKKIGPKTIYGSTKLFAENLCNNYSSLKNIKVTSLRVPNIVGQSLKYGVVRDILLKSKTGKLFLNGKEPGSNRPYIHLEDLTSVIKDIIKKKKYGTFTVGPEDNISVLKIAEIIQNQTGPFDIEWGQETWVGDETNIKLKPEILTKSSLEIINQAVRENL